MNDAKASKQQQFDRVFQEVLVISKELIEGG